MKTSWIYVAPLKNFVLGEELDPVLRVGPVKFVRASSLESTFKDLGFPCPPKEYLVGDGAVLPEGKTLAIVTHTGTVGEAKDRGREWVNQAVEVLACGMYGWARRWHTAHFGAGPSVATFSSVEVLCDRDSSAWRKTSAHRGPVGEVEVDAAWRRGADEYGSFFPLLRVLNDQDMLVGKSRRLFWSAARFAGRSWLAYPSMADALLFGWIALELLLRQRREKTWEVVPRRAGALLGVGRLGYARTGPIGEEVGHLYDLRNDLVHSADESKIEPRDLLFLDDVLHNVLGNLSRLIPEHGRSRAALCAFLDENSGKHERVGGVPHYNAKDHARPWSRIV